MNNRELAIATIGTFIQYGNWSSIKPPTHILSLQTKDTPEFYRDNIGKLFRALEYDRILTVENQLWSVTSRGQIWWYVQNLAKDVPSDHIFNVRDDLMNTQVLLGLSRGEIPEAVRSLITSGYLKDVHFEHSTVTEFRNGARSPLEMFEE